MAERFELFIGGMEIANAYTELNDGDLQEELFRSQFGGDERRRLDGEDGSRLHPALRHGMPPAEGWGLASIGW